MNQSDQQTLNIVDRNTSVTTNIQMDSKGIQNDQTKNISVEPSDIGNKSEEVQQDN